VIRKDDDCPDHSKEYVTAGVCKIVTEALKDKIDAQKALIDTEIKGIKEYIRTTVQTSVTVAGIALTALELVLWFWRR
jgi:hypothetical protein